MVAKYKHRRSRWQFSNIEELVDYVARLTNVEPQTSQSIRFKGSQVKFLRDARIREGAPTVFQNPVLDFITSPYGEITIGSQSFIVQARRPGAYRPGFVYDPPKNIFPTSNNLMCYQDPILGLEVCESDDGHFRSYSDGSASISFHSWREGSPFWSIGTEIKTSGLNFEAAIINSRYYGEALNQTCSVIYDQDSDANDNYLDEYESGIGILSSPPIRVESLCRVQWNGRRISGIVFKGSQCFNVGTLQPWPDEWPEDWPPLNQPPDPIETIGVKPSSLTFIASPPNPSITKTITIKSTFQDAVTITVEAATVNTPPSNDSNPFDPPPLGGPLSGEFTNVSGQMTIPPKGSVNLDVTFTGVSGIGSIPGGLRILWNNKDVTVSLLGKIVEVHQ